MSQLCLLPGIASPPPEIDQPVLSVEPVPRNLVIAPQRYYLTIEQGETCWYYPLQFTEIESRWLLPRLRLLQLDWSLNKGIPVQLETIHVVIQNLVGGAA